MTSVDDRFAAQWSALKAARTRVDAGDGEPLHGGGGGGTSGGMNSDWKKGVEDQLKTLHDDFRKLVGWLIAAVAGPLLAVVGLYIFNGAKFDGVSSRIDGLTEKINVVRVDQEKQRGDARETAARVEAQLSRIEKRLPE